MKNQADIDKNGVVDVPQFRVDYPFFNCSAFLHILRAFAVKIIALSNLRGCLKIKFHESRIFEFFIALTEIFDRLAVSGSSTGRRFIPVGIAIVVLVILAIW